MQLKITLKNALLCSVAIAALSAGVATAANKYGKPKSVIHVVTLFYKDGTTDEQKKAVLDATEKMASEIPGIKNLWLKPVRVQGNYLQREPDGTTKPRPITDAFVIEFESEAAFKAYDDHPAHRAWEKVYTPVRGASITSQITN